MVGEGYDLINILESECMHEHPCNLSLNGFCDSLKLTHVSIFLNCVVEVVIINMK